MIDKTQTKVCPKLVWLQLSTQDLCLGYQQSYRLLELVFKVVSTTKYLVPIHLLSRKLRLDYLNVNRPIFNLPMFTIFSSTYSPKTKTGLYYPISISDSLCWPIWTNVVCFGWMSSWKIVNISRSKIGRLKFK